MSGTTNVVGIIGWPVDRSLSPVIHDAAFEALGMPWVYVPFPVRPGQVREAVEGLAALGVKGANVTMPHKTEVAGLCHERSEDAERLRAVNTLELSGGIVRGHNTDAPGFERFLRRDAGFDPAGKSALLYGAGGGARACALALVRGGLARLTVAVRDPGRAGDLLTAVEGAGPGTVEVIAWGDAAGWRGDLAVDATPLGSDGLGSPPEPAYSPDLLVVDLKYHPPLTPLQVRAREGGATAFGGLGLLLQQAALSFELWTGRPAPLEVMSAAALGALAQD